MLPRYYRHHCCSQPSWPVSTLRPLLCHRAIAVVAAVGGHAGAICGRLLRYSAIAAAAALVALLHLSAASCAPSLSALPSPAAAKCRAHSPPSVAAGCCLSADAAICRDLATIFAVLLRLSRRFVCLRRRLLQMLVGSGRFVVDFAVPTQRLRYVMYWYIAENGRWQRDITIVWDYSSHKT